MVSVRALSIAAAESTNTVSVPALLVMVGDPKSLVDGIGIRIEDLVSAVFRPDHAPGNCHAHAALRRTASSDLPSEDFFRDLGIPWFGIESLRGPGLMMVQ